MLIGICGFQSSGKDTIADYLIKEHGFIKMSFASKLKDIISIMFGWPRNKLEGLTKEHREWRETVDPWWSQTLNIPQLTPRYVMQYFATDLFRNKFHPDIWVKIVENELNNLLEQSNQANIVISDCRFENEMAAILAAGGTLLFVQRGGEPAWAAAAAGGAPFDSALGVHVTDWNSYALRPMANWTIDNNGTLEELYKKVFDYYNKDYNLYKTKPSGYQEKQEQIQCELYDIEDKLDEMELDGHSIITEISSDHGELIINKVVKDIDEYLKPYGTTFEKMREWLKKYLGEN
jgi:hypothetical protein